MYEIKKKIICTNHSSANGHEPCYKSNKAHFLLCVITTFPVLQATNLFAEHYRAILQKAQHANLLSFCPTEPFSAAKKNAKYETFSQFFAAAAACHCHE